MTVVRLRGLSLAFVALAGFGCGSGQPSPEDAAESAVRKLRAIPGDKERAVISALALNTMCSVARLAVGEADGRVEEAVVQMVADQSNEIKDRLATFGDTLERIPAATRAELLGDLDTFDPGLCDAPPDWDRLRHGIVFSHQLIPHLRFPFCTTSLTATEPAVTGR